MKTKALISFAVTAKLICSFVFAYAKCWYSHDAAQMDSKNLDLYLRDCYQMNTCGIFLVQLPNMDLASDLEMCAA